MCVEIVKQKHMAWALFTYITDIEILTGHQNTLEYRDMSKKRIFENFTSARHQSLYINSIR